jgi:ectoine hydroxylase
MVPSHTSVESAALKADYADCGFHLRENLFAADEVAGLCAGSADDTPLPAGALAGCSCGAAMRVAQDGQGAGTRTRLLRLAADPRLVLPAMQLLEADVYVHRLAVGIKPAFVGGGCPWHQDFAAWSRLEAMPRPDAVTVAVFLDDVTQFNGPTFCIPGAHQAGLYPCEAAAPAAPAGGSDADHMRFMLRRDVLAPLVAEWGLFSVRAPRGSAFFFHPNLPHACGTNISPQRCSQVLITYNSVHNRGPQRLLPRTPAAAAGGRLLLPVHGTLSTSC